ncbi:hypothetical protein EDB84DRAFT_1442243 [Lactarius hengduanensis]|nr:hypothetical protein EDB84DRAFT_1442243 [Lactarius hengduanensis]
MSRFVSLAQLKMAQLKMAQLGWLSRFEPSHGNTSQEPPDMAKWLSPNRGHLSAGNHAPKKEGAKKVTFSPVITKRTSPNDIRAQFALLLSYNGVRKRGAGAVNAGTRRRRRSCCATCREAGGLVRPFPREWGATGWGGLASRAPYPRVRSGAARGKGESLVRAPSARMGRVGSRGACPCAPLSCAYRAVRTKGGAGGDVPLVRAPAARMGRVGPGREGEGGGGCPRAHPFGANGEKGRLSVWDRGKRRGLTRLGRPLVQMGRKGLGERERDGAGALVRTPSVRSGRRGQGEREGPEEMGRRGGGQCGVGEEEEGNSPLCAPFLCSSGTAVNAGKGRRLTPSAFTI